MGSWVPILDGALADSARAALRDLGTEIGHHAPSPDDLVLFWAYAASELDATEHMADAIDRLISQLAARGGALQLYGGLAGAGWTLAHVGDPDDCEDFLATIDRALVGALAGPGWNGHYDLVTGLVGIAVYFLERLEGGRDAPLAREGLQHVVSYFAAHATPIAPGLTWHTRPALLPAWQRALAPDGYYNLGVAHGVPGVLSVLARAATLADPPRGCRELVEGALAWFAAQHLPDSRSFPAWLAPGVVPTPSRSAWCYGDPGVATSVWAAAQRIGAPIAPWRELARACATGPGIGVRDASLCHGAFGLAHLYNRCFQASGDEDFAAAARTWIERGLAMRTPGRGVGGFLSIGSTDEDNPWVATDSFLEGAAGIGLVLLAALGDLEPAWDRLIACDLPVRDAQR